MPLYELFDTRSNESTEVIMSYDNLQEHLKNNPHLTMVVNAPRIVSGVAGITHKNDSGFGDLMTRIAQANPYSPLADQYGDKGIKATKTREAVKRAKARATSSDS